MPWIFPEWDAIGLVASFMLVLPAGARGIVAGRADGCHDIAVYTDRPLVRLRAASAGHARRLPLIVLAYLVCAEVLKPVAVRGLDATIQRPLRVMN
jgi:hypothetical protein